MLRSRALLLCSLFVAVTGCGSGGGGGASDTPPGSPGTGDVPLAKRCGPLPAPASGARQRTVSTAAALRQAVEGGAAAGETIFIADGVYTVEPMAVRVPNITIRSASGNRDGVVLDGNYQENAYGNGTIFNVWASGVTIADLTIRHAYNHGVHIAGTESGDTERVLLYDLHVVDNREQQIKANGAGGHVPAGCRLACSLLELTAEGRSRVADYGGYTSCYTGGLDSHGALDWVVEDNVVRGIYCTGRSVNLAEHGVHMWSDNVRPLVQNNVIIDCSRGIGVGMGEGAAAGAVVRNNLVFASPGFAGFDTGIELEGASSATIVHNTIAGPVLLSVNMRRATDTGRLANNLLNAAVHGSSGMAVDHNAVIAGAAPFASVDPASAGFLRLKPGAPATVVDAGAELGGLCPFDIDGDARGARPDIGADELAP